jgi:hypothetical protein
VVVAQALDLSCHLSPLLETPQDATQELPRSLEAVGLAAVRCL